jgi:hypothetical protein
MVDGKGVKKPMESEPGRIGITVEIKPHAYDPVRDWERFEQVLPRRLLAFAIDLAVILAPVGAPVPPLSRHGRLGADLLRRDARSSGLRHARDARHADRDAHMVRRPVFLRGRRPACDRILCVDLGSYPRWCSRPASSMSADGCCTTSCSARS